MIARLLRTAWNEPRAGNPPRRVWRDWVAVGLFVTAGLIEAVARTDLVWPVPSAALLVPGAVSLLWRRTRPLVATLVMFAGNLVVQIASLIADVEWEGLYSMAAILLLLYALTRWGSGREIVIGMTLVVAFATLDIATARPFVLADAIGGYVVLVIVFEAGFLVRSQVRNTEQALMQARMSEREELARELHDTVAHHVSAIAVQAQAGLAVAEANPQTALDAALKSLSVIEGEASLTLTEMRAMVGTLRHDEATSYAPQPGIAELQQLANATGNPLPVRTELSGDLDALPPVVDTTLYRLAQESVTNAFRHARDASQVTVRVNGEDIDMIRLTVEDDGLVDGHAFATPSPATASTTGSYGLIGMAERAKLLGGTFTAGPQPGRGWVVEALLPRPTR